MFLNRCLNFLTFIAQVNMFHPLLGNCSFMFETWLQLQGE